MPDKTDFLETAKQWHKEAIERYGENRKRQREDIRFAAASPDDPWQWQEKDRKDREISHRPALTINKLPQHIRQVTNDIRQNRPSIRYRPADDKADAESADILMGIVRHIEAHSDADVAYDVAADNQVTHGEGFIRVLADYNSETSFDQDIKIMAMQQIFRCHLDPDRQDPVGSDAKWAIIDDDMSEDEFKKQYPKAEAIDWNHDQDATWFTPEKRVMIAEVFSVEEEEKTLLLWTNGQTSFEGDKMPEGVFMGEVPVKKRKSTRCKVMWRKINGKEVLEEREFPSKFIPIVRVVGNEYIVDGKRIVSGIVRNAKDSQRMYNVAQSAIVERVMQAPKAPFIAPAEAVEGYEKTWQTANTANHSYLPYNHVDAEGNAIPAPVRNNPTTVESGLQQVAMGASDDIKAETGQYDASMGAKSNETSGRAIMARQREGDTATFHYVDNLGRSVRQLGKIILDMIPRIYDTKRVGRILGEDGDIANVTIDPQSPQALTKIKDEKGEIARIFNPQIGLYDVYATTGPSFTTRRVEAVEAMTAMTQANPELWQVIGDQLVKNMDWPGAEDMAERLKLTLLPAVQEKLAEQDGGEGEVPPQIKMAMQQMEQQVQQLDGAIQGMTEELQQKDEAARAAQLKLEQETSKRIKADTENYVLKASQKLAQDEQEAISRVQQAMQPPMAEETQEMPEAEDNVAPMLEALVGALQQQAEQQMQMHSELIAAVQEGAASTQASVEQMAQALIAERMQPKTVRTPSGKTIQYDPSTGSMTHLTQ